MTKTRILLADDHPALLAETARLLGQEQHVVDAAADGAIFRLASDLVFAVWEDADFAREARRLGTDADGLKSRLELPGTPFPSVPHEPLHKSPPKEL